MSAFIFFSLILELPRRSALSRRLRTPEIACSGFQAGHRLTHPFPRNHDRKKTKAPATNPPIRTVAQTQDEARSTVNQRGVHPTPATTIAKTLRPRLDGGAVRARSMYAAISALASFRMRPIQKSYRFGFSRKSWLLPPTRTQPRS